MMTPEQIAEFQRGHDDWAGNPLRVDGALGPRTQWALEISRLDPRRQAIVERACSSVGIAELVGQANRSAQIDSWLARCGAPLGSPWCAAFASWCLSVNGLPVTRLGGAQALGRSLAPTLDPVPGDIMWFATGSWTGHCGIVIGVGPEEVATVEGNQHDAVRLARRRRAEVRFARSTPELLPHGAAVPPELPLIPVKREGTR
jgi:hypothetical protein